MESVLAFQFSWIWVGAQFSTGCGFGHPGGLADFRLSAIALDALIRLRAASHLLSPFPRGPRVRRLPSEEFGFFLPGGRGLAGFLPGGVFSFSPGAAGSQASSGEFVFFPVGDVAGGVAGSSVPLGRCVWWHVSCVFYLVSFFVPLVVPL